MPNAAGGGGQNSVCTANFAVCALSLSLSLSLLAKQPAVCGDLFVLFRVFVRQVFGIDRTRPLTSRCVYKCIHVYVMG